MDCTVAILEQRMNRNTPQSHAAREATSVLGKMIRARRIQQRITAAQLAERAGITRTTLRGIERGEPKTAIGTVFEVAAIVGVRLFDLDSDTLTLHRRRLDEELALLPKSARITQPIQVDTDF